MTNTNKTLCLKEIIELRNEILVEQHRTGQTIEECAAFIENQMDGTQNPMLITEAIASAKAKPLSKIKRVMLEMQIRNAILLEMQRTGQTPEEAGSWIKEIMDDKYIPVFAAGLERAIADQHFGIDQLMDESQDITC